MKELNKVYLLGDIHGRSFWRPILDIDPTTYDKVIFLGDYSDPYSYEGFTHDDAIRELTDIVQFKKDNPDKVVLLLGNHDLTNVDPDIFTACRWSREHYPKYKELITDQLDLYQICYEFEQDGQLYTASHAGIGKPWFDSISAGNTKNQTHGEFLNELFQNKEYPPFGMISFYRGGMYRYGSCVWADLNEFNKHHHHLDANIIQIVGHTQQVTDPVIKDNLWCLDCRKIFILENNKLEEYVHSS